MSSAVDGTDNDALWNYGKVACVRKMKALTVKIERVTLIAKDRFSHIWNS
jgi:hypothetical protein